MIIDFNVLPFQDSVKKGKFKKFCDFLLDSNKKFNITAITEPNDVYLKHFADSLAGVDNFSDNAHVLEIGSGGGFPSIPLKICRPDLKFTLAESNAKKCNFLKEAGELLDFESFTVINSRAEDLPQDFKGKFDVVTARAVAGSSVLCELTLPYLRVGGKAVFYKNYSEEEIEGAARSAGKLGAELTAVQNYKLDGVDGERCVIIIEKTTVTDEKYPRPYNKILKKPL